MTVHHLPPGKPPGGPPTLEWLERQNFPAVLTGAQSNRLADSLVAPRACWCDRAALALLARSSDELMSAADEDPADTLEAWMDLSSAMRNRIVEHRAEVERLEMAEARLLVLLAKAEARCSSEKGGA